MKQQHGEIKKINKQTAVVIIIVALLLISAAVICAIQLTHKPAVSSSAPVLQNTGSAVDGTYKPSSAAASGITITDRVSSFISFSSGSKGTKGNWVCENIPENKVVVQAQIFLNGKCIAQSAPIKPGQHIESITLKNSLHSGNYTAIAYLNYFNMATHSFISKSGYRLSLSVA